MRDVRATEGTGSAGRGDPPRQGAALLTLEVIEDAPGFDALEREWNALLERSEATVFQTFEWQRTWWRHFGEGRRDARLHLVVVREAGGLAAVAPLYVERAGGPGPLALRRLLFVGHRHSDYLDVLVARGRERQCAALLAAHLTEHAGAFDVAFLEELRDGSPAGTILPEALAREGWAAARHVEEQCPRTALSATWEETLAAFPPRDRREARRRLRNWETVDGEAMEVVERREDLAPAMAELVEQHQARWEDQRYWGVFSDPRYAEFNHDVAARLLARGWLFLSFLRAGGRRCAVHYGFAFRDTLAIYLTGARADEALRVYSPGRVLHARSMQWAIARGKTVYDFMRGTETYKYDFAAVDVPNWTVVAYPPGARIAKAKHAAYRRLDTVARRARNEAQALRATARQGGWLSPATARHVRHVVLRGARDVLRKLRGAPARGMAR